jgi:hypothetical protein
MKLFPVVIAGVVVGTFMPLFSQLPILNTVNCIPCGWIWVGGIIVVGLYRWLADADEPLFASDGAILGIFTGIVAALSALILSILLYGNDPLPEASTRILPLLDQVRETFHLTDPRQTSYMFVFLFDLITYPIISAISGVVGIQLFGKTTSRRTASSDPGGPFYLD